MAATARSKHLGSARHQEDGIALLEELANRDEPQLRNRTNHNDQSTLNKKHPHHCLSVTGLPGPQELRNPPFDSVVGEIVGHLEVIVQGSPVGDFVAVHCPFWDSSVGE